jgi:hypothetical protein
MGYGFLHYNKQLRYNKLINVHTSIIEYYNVIIINLNNKKNKTFV